MKTTPRLLSLLAIVSTLGFMLAATSCTTAQQDRLLAATEAAALTALEAKAHGAPSKLARSSGIIAGLAAYKNPPSAPVVIAEEVTASK